MLVGVIGRVHGLEQALEDATVGAIFALALLVLHNAALLVQLLLGDGAKEVAHAIGFHPQHPIERGARNGLEVVRAIKIRGAVQARGADFLQGLEPFIVVVFGAVEHQVFEQMGEARATLRLVLRADLVPDADADYGRLAILMDDDRQPVVEFESLEGQVDFGLRARGQQDRYGQAREGAQMHGDGLHAVKLRGAMEREAREHTAATALDSSMAENSVDARCSLHVKELVVNAPDAVPAHEGQRVQEGVAEVVVAHARTAVSPAISSDRISRRSATPLACGDGCCEATKAPNSPAVIAMKRPPR